MHTKVLDFWFNEIKPAQWWKKDEGFDRLIEHRFSEIHARACRCELYEWRATAPGKLAEIIVLDQFSRNMFRGSPRAFAYDPLALALAQEAVAVRADEQLDMPQRSFLFMPYMHSESLAIHAIAMQLFENKCSPESFEFEKKHQQIIATFGRYPHRNRVLGRISTREEIEFLKQPGSSF